MYRLLWVAIAIVLGSAIAYAQIINPSGGGGTPGGAFNSIQYNSAGSFGGIANSVPGNCLTYATPPVWGSCAAGSQTSIAAGSNITTSGSAGNVTVNVVATPSFTTLIASGNITAGTAQFTGAASGTTAVFQTITDAGITGCVQASGGLLTGTGVNCASQTSTPSIAAGSNITTSGTASNVTVNVVATPSFTTIINSGNLTSGTAQFTGAVSGTTAQFQTYTGATANLTGNLTGTTAQFSGQVTGTTSVFQTITAQNFSAIAQGLAPSSGGGTTNFLRADGNWAAPASSGTSIAAGSNITTSGTASNVTVNAVPTTPTGSIQINSSGAFAALTGSSAQLLLAQSGVAAPSFNTLSQDCTVSATGVITCTKTNNVAFSALATAATPLTLSLGGTSAALVPANGGIVTVSSTTMAVTTLSTGILIGSSTATVASSNSLVLNSALGSFGVPVTISGNLTSTTAQFAGFLTASGASLQTSTVAGNLTATTTFSNAGWMTASGANFNTATIAGALNGSTGNFTSNLTATLYTGTATGAGMLAFVSPSIAQFELAGAGNAATPATGWLNWGGEARLTSARGFLNSSTLSPTSLSVSLQAGRSYSVDADLYINAPTAGATSGGIQAALTGTYGSAATNYFGWTVDTAVQGGTGGNSNPERGAVLASAKNTSVGATLLSGTTAYLKITGTVSVSTSGTLVVAVAQNSATTAATTLAIGSRLMVHDMP